jgi:tubulin-specific chaperone C
MKRFGKPAFQGKSEETTIQKSTVSNSDVFWNSFNAELKSILNAVQAVINGTSSLDEQTFMQKYEEWLLEARKLQLQVNDNAISLPPYDVRKAQSAIDDLVLEIERCKAKLLPRKKFAFKNHASRTASVGEIAGSNLPHSSSALGLGEAGTSEAAAINSTQLISSSSTSSIGSSTITSSSLLTDYTVQGAKDQVIVLDSRSDPSFSANRDVHLLNLERCTVAILEPINALRMDDLRDCSVLCTSVRGSALLHACSTSSFFLSARQIRVHTTQRCDFYIHVASRPIIEHCSHLRFAPFEVVVAPPAAAAAAATVASTHLGSEAKSAQSALWAQVDDFNWHRVQASPNWCILPESERVGYRGLRADMFKQVSTEIRFTNDSSGAQNTTEAKKVPEDVDDDDEEL